MTPNNFDYIYIAGTITCTVYGQIILKWRIDSIDVSFNSNSGLTDLFQFFAVILTDPYVLSGFIAAFMASLFWMIAMTKFELSFAYPFTVLAPAIVFILGIWLFGESLTLGKILGLVFIILGLIITVKL